MMGIALDCFGIGHCSDKLSMHYTGTLFTTGAKFDSSRDRGRTFDFTLGNQVLTVLMSMLVCCGSSQLLLTFWQLLKLGIGQVIKGWDQGLLDMCVGEKRKLTIPSDLAYGSRAMGSAIPANSVLVFDVELVRINGKDEL